METQEKEQTAPQSDHDDTIRTDALSGWVLCHEPEHVCIKPDIDNRTFVGSIWRCGGCGQHWLVYERRGQRKGQKALRRIDASKAITMIEKASQKAARSTT